MDPDAANRVLTQALAAGPRCGSLILIGIDGPSGSGKTTLASAIAAQAQGQRVATVHVDDICPGWHGLEQVPQRLATIAAQLSTHGEATYPTWDWHANAPGTPAHIAGATLVIVEGTCALDPAWADHRSLSVWMNSPLAIRRERALRRDGDIYTPHWDAWARDEAAYYTSTTMAPDLVIENP